MPSPTPTALFILAAFAVALGTIAIGVIVFMRIWRLGPFARRNLIENEHFNEGAEFWGTWGDENLRRARAAANEALDPVARVVTRSRVERAERLLQRMPLLAFEYEQGPQRRPYDGEHRRDVPYHAHP